MKTFQYAMRFLLRARSYTLINLLGLAFSLACCIVLLRYIHREYTVDVHCVDRNEVYAVRVDMEGNSYWGAYSVYQDSILIAPELIDVTCRFTPLDNDYLISDGHRYPCAALATDSTFFRLFSFRTVQGEQDLNDPSSVILTEGYAHRLFGKENPIGKTIRYSNGKDFVVKGVIAKPENKAWLNFDLLLPDTPSNQWERMPLELYRFVAGADMDQINRIGSYPRRVNPHWPDDTRMYTFSLVPLKECYWSGLKTTDDGHIFVWGDRAQLRIFISLCVLLLLTGILNFINLYLIFMLKRTHEYGIYNPQNEMFWHFRTKCSFPKTKRTSLILFLFITYNKKASKKNVFLRCFLLCYLLHNSQKITNFIAYKQGVILCCNAVLMSL